MKTTRKFINENETCLPCVVGILSGKHGQFAKINGINYSAKKMAENGYSVRELTSLAISEIEEKNANLKAEKNRIGEENFIKTLTEISFTFKNGEKILSVPNFKDNSRNIGQETQGSDAHEAMVLIDGKEYNARKHWSHDGIGIWDAAGYVGDIFFIEGKVFLRKSE